MDLKNVTKEELAAVLKEKQAFTTALTSLVKGYREAMAHFDKQPLLNEHPVIKEAAQWSLLTDETTGLANPNGEPWKYESLVNLVVSALCRIVELEDLNTVEIDGSRRGMIR